jgi:TRAP-type C4-dicarboxylate transport system permease small subunit
MRKRVIFGLFCSSLLIIFSVIMSIYSYIYFTSNRVGVLGDGKFHFSSITTFVFTFISGSLFLIVFIAQAYKDRQRKK